MSTAPCLFKDNKGNQCYAIVVKGTGYCKMHQKPAWDGFRERYSKEFIRNRPVVIRKAGGQCQNEPDGHQRCSRRGTDVDHIVPRSQGGSDHLYNLQLLCLECHKAKTNSDTVAENLKNNTNAPRGRR